MNAHKNIITMIGNTPLIYLKEASLASGCEIYGKAEFLNPGQSIKDRAALYIINDAIARGILKPGGTIVEGTAGNTGIGLALVASALGFKTIIVIPETQSQEKKDAIRLAGAELVEVPAAPYSNPNSYVPYSGRLAKKLAEHTPNGVIWANQFDNIANRQAHLETTALEIWEQTSGHIDGFICSVGSGGTLAGVAAGLRAQNAHIKIGIADPYGAALYSYYSNGKLTSTGSSVIEGIGQGRITKNLEGLEVDYAYQISDGEALHAIFELAQNEAMVMGGSSGINIAGAVRMGREMGGSKKIVTILCDYGARYQSKIYNPHFLKAKDLPLPAWLVKTNHNVPSVFV